MSVARRLTHTLVGALAVTALAAPAASARPIDQRPTHTSAPTLTVIRTIDQSFDLGAATIGAGGTAAVLLLTAAGAAGVSQRRHRARVAR
jgi:hypothetical protein